MGVSSTLIVIASIVGFVVSAAAQPCTPAPDVLLQVEIASELTTLVVGDKVRVTGRVRNDSVGVARGLHFELRGGGHLLQQVQGIVVDPTPSERPTLDGGAAYVVWIDRVAAHAGAASLVLAVTYEAAVGCSEEPHYEQRLAVSAPVAIEVEPSTACWGDCDGDAAVRVDEIQSLVGMILGDVTAAGCAFTPNPDDAVTVDELVTAITNALEGCPPLRSCGGPEALVCPGRSWCEFPPGDCGTGGRMGSCIEMRTLCYTLPNSTGSGLGVCGCDGATYANDCERSSAQVSQAHDGLCP